MRRIRIAAAVFPSTGAGTLLPTSAAWLALTSAGVVIVVLLTALAAVPLAAQTLPSKKDAADMVAKAAGRMALTGAGAAPLHAVAKIKYTVGSASFDGSYELMWASPDRYREEFRLGPLMATYVAAQDKLYIRRNSPTLTYMQWRVRQLMRFPVDESVAGKVDVGKVYTAKKNSEEVVCAELKSSGKGNAQCFSPASGAIVSWDDKVVHEKPRVGLSEDNFTDFGALRVAGHIVSTIDDETLEIHMDKLEAVNHFDDATFAAPDGATAHDWCAKPEVRVLAPDPTIFSFSILSGSYQGDVPAEVIITNVYLRAGPDGHAQKLAAIHRDGSATDLTDRKQLQKQFPIHACAGKPVEYEQIFGLAIPTGVDLGPTQLEHGRP